MLDEVAAILTASIRTNTDILNAFAELFLGGTAIFIILWLAYKSPQASQAKIEKDKYLRSEREKHYRRLNEDIFLPLSNEIVVTAKGLPNEKEKLSLKISSTINNPDIEVIL